MQTPPTTSTAPTSRAAAPTVQPAQPPALPLPACATSSAASPSLRNLQRCLSQPAQPPALPLPASQPATSAPSPPATAPSPPATAPSPPATTSPSQALTQPATTSPSTPLTQPVTAPLVARRRGADKAPDSADESVCGVDPTDISDSEVNEDSSDEDFTPDSEATTSNRSWQRASSEAEEEEDISIFLNDASPRARVTEGKARELEFLLCSLDQMTKQERTTSLYTLLAVLMQTPTVERKRRRGDREKFPYILPYVGHVCRPTFAFCYGVVPISLQRYKMRIRDGNMSIKTHGNRRNTHAAQVNVDWLVKWFQSFAEEVGEVMAVRCPAKKWARRAPEEEGAEMDVGGRRYSTLLPAHFTRDTIYDEVHKFVEAGLRVREPARSTMRKLLTLHCPTIRIRSPRSNVRDVCSIYHAGMRGGVTSAKTEALGRHTESARRMRREYKTDKTSTDANPAVIAQDEEAWIAGMKKYLMGEVTEDEARSYGNIAADYEIDCDNLLFYCPLSKKSESDAPISGSVIASTGEASSRLRRNTSVNVLIARRGNTKLLIWVDLFTGYMIAKASDHDRKPGFMADFFRAFNKILGMRQRMFVEDLNQRDWDEYAERLTFTINTAQDRIRGDSPFYLVHEWDPGSTLEATIPLGNTRTQDRDPRRWRYRIQKHYDQTRSQVNARLREAITDRADRHYGRVRSHPIATESQVWLYLDRVKEGYTRKLAHLWHGPFRVAEKINEYIMKLQIAGTDYNLFPIVHVSKLELVKDFPDRLLIALTVNEADRLDFDEGLLPEVSWVPDRDANEYEPDWVDEGDLNCEALLHEFIRDRVNRNRFSAIQSHGRVRSDRQGELVVLNLLRSRGIGQAEWSWGRSRYWFRQGSTGYDTWIPVYGITQCVTEESAPSVTETGPSRSTLFMILVDSRVGITLHSDRPVLSMKCQIEEDAAPSIQVENRAGISAGTISANPRPIEMYRENVESLIESESTGQMAIEIE
ncbi:hypothetical protein PHYSODRAFT_337674 [Phytophthora sojae]|uniref:Uncharacterized protein n=1 Tax=Phytophthora sojae (strain P6497) TaxID=1094619 RepID=G5A1V5_PHYSP|nr:hypothetical protein PHYSODRAFT_337674 [Phytophthora sojae]EGZ10903.1 hypothetical protein PHYSODRAFT_337674 [Phytophthora sojae]|eukprot:XP_009533648.1 hypothetical protein PHYSODRAFT_337674 [Phytophthora sojae]